MNTTVKKIGSYWYVIAGEATVIGRVKTKAQAMRYIDLLPRLRTPMEIKTSVLLDQLSNTYWHLLSEKGYEFQEWDEAPWIVKNYQFHVPEVYYVDVRGRIYLCGIGWSAVVRIRFPDLWSEGEAQLYSYDLFSSRSGEILNRSRG